MRVPRRKNRPAKVEVLGKWTRTSAEPGHDIALSVGLFLTDTSAARPFYWETERLCTRWSVQPLV